MCLGPSGAGSLEGCTVATFTSKLVISLCHTIVLRVRKSEGEQFFYTAISIGGNSKNMCNQVNFTSSVCKINICVEI